MKKKEKIRIMLVDDHPAFRKGMAALIESEADFEVVAEVGDGNEAIKMFHKKQPDVVLMDLRLPGMGGVEAIIAIRKEAPDARIIVLTTYDLDEDIYRAIESGASSYLLKDTSEEVIAETIRSAYSGLNKLPAKMAERLNHRRQRSELTEREMQVLHYVVKGRSNKEIGVALFLSEATIKAHLKTLFAKLEVQDRTEAAINAVRLGIVHLE